MKNGEDMQFDFKTGSVQKNNIPKGMTVFNTNELNVKKQPMFFGAPLGVQRYDSYKYPVFDKLTTQQMSYFGGSLEEVSLQKIVLIIKHYVLSKSTSSLPNLKYQVMLDSVQGRAPGMAFMPYCSLPELESAMMVWQFMEMIHSRSYTYIIKNVYADPSDVFDTMLSDPKILDRAASVTESYDTFINAAQTYGSGNRWEQALEGVDGAMWDLY